MVVEPAEMEMEMEREQGPVAAMETRTLAARCP